MPLFDKIMVRRTVLAATAVLAAILLAQTDVAARGGGGFHMGGVGAFHARGFTGSWRGGWSWGRMGSPFRMGAHGSVFHGRGPRHTDRHDTGHEHHQIAGHDHHDAANHHDNGRHGDRDGHWHQSAGFGDMRRVSSHMNGEWHRSAGFGDASHNSSGGQGVWHAETHR